MATVIYSVVEALWSKEEWPLLLQMMSRLSFCKYAPSGVLSRGYMYIVVLQLGQELSRSSRMYYKISAGGQQ